MTHGLTASDHVVAVGTGLGGWRFVEGLRREGFAGRISLIGAESHLPYDRPPLSKQILAGKWPSEQAHIATAERLAELDVDGHFGSAASNLVADDHEIHLESGEVVHASRIVIATGCRARRLSVSAGERVETLRTLDDVRRISAVVADLAPESTVAIIGGGFVGAEVATSLLARGLRPIVLEVLAMPLLTVLGPVVASWLVVLPHHAGIELRGDQNILDVVEDEGRFHVRIEGSDDVVASLVLAGVGAEPNTEWLMSSGLEIRNGVVVNDRLRATETIAALGDVARFTWRHDPFVEEVRMEHWQVANDHAAFLAASFARGDDDTPPHELLPYFWSDQYGKKVQLLGHPAPSDHVTLVKGDPGDLRWLALYARDEVVTGAVALSDPRALMLTRDAVAAHWPLARARDETPWTA